MLYLSRVVAVAEYWPRFLAVTAWQNVALLIWNARQMAAHSYISFKLLTGTNLRHEIYWSVMRQFTRRLEKWDYATRMNNVAWTKVQDYKQETVSDVSVCIQVRSRNALPTNSRFIDLYLVSIPNMQVECFQVSSSQFLCYLIMIPLLTVFFGTGFLKIWFCEESWIYPSSLRTVGRK